MQNQLLSCCQKTTLDLSNCWGKNSKNADISFLKEVLKRGLDLKKKITVRFCFIFILTCFQVHRGGGAATGGGEGPATGGGGGPAAGPGCDRAAVCYAQPPHHQTMSMPPASMSPTASSPPSASCLPLSAYQPCSTLCTCWDKVWRNAHLPRDMSFFFCRNIIEERLKLACKLCLTISRTNWKK